MHPQRGRGELTHFLKLFNHSATFILIIFLLYRRKFCDGHIILVYLCYSWDVWLIFYFEKKNESLASNFSFIILIVELKIYAEICISRALNEAKNDFKK